MPEISPTSDSKKIRDFLRSAYTPGDGLAARDSTLSRLIDSYQIASKQYHIILLVSVISSILYGIRVFGLSFDLVVSGQHIFKLPYGIFIFAFVAQLSFVTGCLRCMDAFVYDRMIRSIAEEHFEHSSEFLFRTFIGSYEWFSGPIYTNKAGGLGIFHRLIYTIFSILYGLVIIFFLISPIIVGAYFLYDWKRQAVGDFIYGQWWLVFIGTSLASLGLILLVSLYAQDNDE